MRSTQATGRWCSQQLRCQQRRSGQNCNIAQTLESLSTSAAAGSQPSGAGLWNTHENPEIS